MADEVEVQTLETQWVRPAMFVVVANDIVVHGVQIGVEIMLYKVLRLIC